MSVYGYVRVSTVQQVEDGLSLDTQQKQLEGYAMMRGITIDEIFIEKGVSASKSFASRPAGCRLCAAMRQGDTLLVSKLDRLFRSAREALVVSDELHQQGISLHFLDLGGDITDNGLSKVFFTIVAAFAEFERDRTAERIRDIKQQEASKRRYLGGSRPFGYNLSPDGALVPHEEEQQIYKKVVALRNTGMSYRLIAEQILNLYQYPISHMMVKRLILRTSY